VKKLTEAVAGENSYAPLFAVSLTAFYYPLIYWTLRGMEVGLLCLLVNYAMLCAFRLYDRYSQRDIITLTVTLMAGFLTRPDMVVPMASVLCGSASCWAFGTLAPGSSGHDRWTYWDQKT